MSAGGLVDKFERKEFIPKMDDKLMIKESFLTGLINSWRIGYYFPYLAMGYYDLLSESHLI
ncbi:MAG: hypothetical protein ABIH28_02395 [archaeon]